MADISVLYYKFAYYKLVSWYSVNEVYSRSAVYIGGLLKIEQLSLEFTDGVYRNDGIIGYNELPLVFLKFLT